MIMKKKLLAVAIASTFAAPFAMAQEGSVTLYGTASAAIESISLDNVAGLDFDAMQINNNHSAFGIKGSQSLANDLKAVFLVDMFVGLDNSNSGNGSVLGGGRDGYVGLAGDFGTVALGYHGRPWKTSTNGLDMFGSTIADYSAIMGTSNGTNDAYFDGGIGNAAIWFLPNMGGFSGHVQLGMDEADNGSQSSGAQFNYTAGGLYASVSLDKDETATTDRDVTKLAASYTFAETTTVTGMVEAMSGSALNNNRNALYLGASHKFGSNTAKVAFASADDSDAAGASDGADYVAIGVDHSLSKSATLYALYSRVSNDAGGSYAFTSAPHTSSYTDSGVNAGAEMSVLAVGMKYNF